MNPKWAEENLQTIRTLMERSALYRRALAPVMVYVGTVGLFGGIIGYFLEINLRRGFVSFWSGTAAVALIGAFILIRRQALKDSEPVWSPPTRRVAQALVPPFVIGAFIAMFVALSNGFGAHHLIMVWCWMFGCAICSASFVMPRSMKYFGWAFILTGFYLAAGILLDLPFDQIFIRSNHSPHLLMAAIFGGLHLAYGIYLYFTEKKTPVA